MREIRLQPLRYLQIDVGCEAYVRINLVRKFHIRHTEAYNRKNTQKVSNVQMNLYSSEFDAKRVCSSGISRKEQMLGNQMRLLWEQHVYWTRLVISGIVFHSPDLEASQTRLLRNPGDFAAALSPFYGRNAAARFAGLLTEHLTIAGELVTAAAAGKNQEAADAEKRWYANADQIAVFLSSINPNWTIPEWREMLYRHLDMTKQEATDFINGNYAASVEVFDRIEQEALEMADRMTEGIVQQFPFLF